MYIQGIYIQYSRLRLSSIQDRPFAIAGLEKVLLRAFRISGGFGIFSDIPHSGMFHCSLLWQRGRDQDSMVAIDFSAHRRVPSWSWMAYSGAIDYSIVPFSPTDWEVEEIRSPWSNKESHDVQMVLTYSEAALTAVVRDFDVANREQNEAELVYDIEPTTYDGHRTQCVVIARSKEEKTSNDQMFHVLLVVTTGIALDGGEMEYKRVGIGRMLGKFISLDQPGIHAKIY